MQRHAAACHTTVGGQGQGGFGPTQQDPIPLGTHFWNPQNMHRLDRNRLNHCMCDSSPSRSCSPSVFLTYIIAKSRNLLFATPKRFLCQNMTLETKGPLNMACRVRTMNEKNSIPLCSMHSKTDAPDVFHFFGGGEQSDTSELAGVLTFATMVDSCATSGSGVGAGGCTGALPTLAAWRPGFRTFEPSTCFTVLPRR